MQKKRLDSYGNELPLGVFQRGDKYHVLISASHGSYKTIEEAKSKVDLVKAWGGGSTPSVPEVAAAPEPTPSAQTDSDQETRKTLLLLKIRNAIASKEAYIAMANMETAGVKWSHPWDAGWTECGKKIKALVEEILGEEAQNGQS